ncbi:MAG TPA: NAD(P)/FAD-dependent oxidoreductase [Planctomycetaceae bacterium]|nr:NAD(P)/FAD-dependent oxidoreductase [Planctomycetaceae bacterium]
MHYDALIIGAGLSGLAAGIRLAYYEKRVCILERHTTIGGLNSFYRLRGRNYDVGLHAVTNFALPGTKTGPLSKLLRQLRLRWEDFALCPQTESRIDFPGCRLRFSNDFALLESQVAERFPDQIDRFRRLVWSLDDEDIAGARGPYPTARAALRAHLTDPLLVDMLLCPLMFYGSATPHDMEFAQFVIMFRSIYREGFGRPYDGVRRILKHVVRQYRELGGELRLRAGVQAINTEGPRAVGVVLDDGEELTADCILSSAGAAETARLCRRPGVRNGAAEGSPAPGDITFVETIATLDCQPADLGHRETIIFYSDTPDFVYDNPADPCDLRSGIICSPNNFQYDQPLPEGSVRITALANKDYWMNLTETEYRAAKQLWYDRIVSSALPHIPDFRSRVVDTDTFTPRTIRQFTGHLNGCVYGAPDKHWDGTTELENLFLCGTDQGYLGIVGSMISGISMANQHVLRSS